MSRKIEIDMDTAERIALSSMLDHYEYLTSELEDHVQNGAYMHEEDVHLNRELVHCLKKLIKYYGGELP
jgi:hypothetical protein